MQLMQPKPRFSLPTTQMNLPTVPMASCVIPNSPNYSNFLYNNNFKNVPNNQSPKSFQQPNINTKQSNSKCKIDTKRRFFTQNEDILLAEAAVQYNEKSWNIIAQCVPGRTPRQCRDRWMNYLKPNLKFDPWTKEEDELLISLVNKHGTHWTKMISNFPGRSTNAIKNRWNWLLKDRVSVVESPLCKKYVLISTDIPSKIPNVNEKIGPKNNESEQITIDKSRFDKNDDSNTGIKNNKNQITASVKNNPKICDENIFTLWQEPINIGFDVEEINW